MTRLTLLSFVVYVVLMGLAVFSKNFYEKFEVLNNDKNPLSRAVSMIMAITLLGIFGSVIGKIGDFLLLPFKYVFDAFFF